MTKTTITSHDNNDFIIVSSDKEQGYNVCILLEHNSEHRNNDLLQIVYHAPLNSFPLPSAQINALQVCRSTARAQGLRLHACSESQWRISC